MFCDNTIALLVGGIPLSDTSLLAIINRCHRSVLGSFRHRERSIELEVNLRAEMKSGARSKRPVPFQPKRLVAPRTGVGGVLSIEGETVQGEKKGF